MSTSSEQPWSDNTNAPQIPLWVYDLEKDIFSGQLMGAIFYGIVVALFFRCMGVLLSPANSIGRGVKLALVLHTAAMFAFLTIPIGMNANNLSTCYVNDREYPGNDESPAGPIGYSYVLDRKAETFVFDAMFPLNQWLADGLLLHRCYVIYSMNHWAMAFPCLVYLASVATAIMYIYQQTTASALGANFGVSYFSISLSLNVILTLMIVIRLVLHRRNLRKVLGTSDGSSGLYTAIVTMLIESYALYAIAFLLYIVPWALGSTVVVLFSPLIGPAQVIAPYLIILRVANRRALTSDMITYGSRGVSSIQFKSQGESTYASGSFPDGTLASLMGAGGDAPGGPGVGTEDVIEEVPS